jgi:hypothetical protein
MCGCIGSGWGGGGGLLKVGEGTERACGNGAINTQHGTGMERRLPLCTKGCFPQIRVFTYFSYHTCVIIHYMCCKYASCAIHIVLLCRLKINHVMETRNMRLFLGLLAWW